MSRVSWHARLLLLWPRRIDAHLHRLVDAGLIAGAPTMWQMELAVLRMWHRVLFRGDTVGTCTAHPARRTWRARILRFRPLRFPFLVWERAVAPLDHSGLAQPSWRLMRHLLGAHHDERQFAYDLEILKAQPGALEEVRDRARAVVEGTDPRATWLRDLVVYERYHENLLAGVEEVLAGESLVDPAEVDDPDITLDATIRWCLAQPATPGDTWRLWRSGAFPRQVLPRGS